MKPNEMVKYVAVSLLASLAAASANATVITAADYDYDVGDYVQEGLVAQYDGIRNEGANLPHNPAAANWADLKTSVNFLVFGGTSEVAIASGRWEGGNSYVFSYNYAYMNSNVSLGTNITVQVVLDADFDAQAAECAATGNWRCKQSQYVGVDDAGVWHRPGYDYLRWKNTSWCQYTIDLTGWEGKYLNLITTYENSYLGQNAAYENETDRGNTVKPFDRCKWAIGGFHSTKTASYGTINERLTMSRYYAARFYNRPLTVAELKHNRRIDEIRFRGAVYTNVVVAASSYAGVSGVETAGVYEVVGSHTFTAPDTTVNGLTYSADGYVIETRGGSGWVNAQAFSGNSYTYTVSDDSQIVRLTWLWKPSRGIRTAAEYDVGDYVQGGLVAQYDGVRNVGADLAHDATAATWKDLKSDNYMTFNGTTDVAVTTGSWAGGNAYCFKGDSYALMANAISLGTNITVQLAMDIDNDAQIAADAARDTDGAVSTYPTYLCANSDYGFFTRPYLPTVWQRWQVLWKNDYWTGANSAVGGRSSFSDWTCKYLTGITTSSKSYAFQGVKYTSETEAGSEIARSVFLPFDNVRWSVGGAHYANNPSAIDVRLSRGLYYSARFYNRSLREAELAQNRKVDEIRFYGAVYTNVVVASSKPLAQGVQPNGVYEVLTEGTFTAAPVAAEKGGVSFTYMPAGYTIERWTNGAWGTPESHDGTNYTYVVANESGAPVRLTWQWRADGLGMMIMYR